MSIFRLTLMLCTVIGLAGCAVLPPPKSPASITDVTKPAGAGVIENNVTHHQPTPEDIKKLAHLVWQRGYNRPLSQRSTDTIYLASAQALAQFYLDDTDPPAANTLADLIGKVLQTAGVQ